MVGFILRRFALLTLTPFDDPESTLEKRFQYVFLNTFVDTGTQTNISLICPAT